MNRLYQVHDTDGEQTGLVLVSEDRLKRPADELDELVDLVSKECGGDCDLMVTALAQNDVEAERMFVENIYA